MFIWHKYSAQRLNSDIIICWSEHIILTGENVLENCSWNIFLRVNICEDFDNFNTDFEINEYEKCIQK